MREKGGVCDGGEKLQAGWWGGGGVVPRGCSIGCQLDIKALGSLFGKLLSFSSLGYWCCTADQ